MKQFLLRIPPEVADVIRHLPPDLKRSIKYALRALAQNPLLGQPLRGELQGLWKYRVRRFRIVYSIDAHQTILRILAVGPWSEIYERIAAKVRAADVRRRK